MSKFFKIYSVILFFNVSLFFLAMLTGAMLEGELGKLFLILLFGWTISLTLYYTAVFMQRVRRAEERINKFFTPKHNRKFDI